MIRRIVKIKSHEWLEHASMEKSFAPAENMLENTLKPKNCKIDKKFVPVQIKGKGLLSRKKPRAMGFNYSNLDMPTKETEFGIRVEFEDEDSIDTMKNENPEEVIGVYADPTITAFHEVYFGNDPVGNDGTVLGLLDGEILHQKGITGKNIRVAVVDTGVNSGTVPVTGGWAPPGINYQPGSAPLDHGTMVAYDVKITAPDSQILDYALLQSTGPTWTAFLSDAIAAFADLINLIQTNPGPLIVNNSWGMYDRNEDAPIGSPENYSANMDHPFNQIVGALVAAGADVFFAAGNCGEDCPDSRCGNDDIGIGRSIHGANSHPEAITVAAVTTNHQRLCYSSQGPGGLYRRKPDIAAYSHFSGSGVYPSDGGTSAASPVAAGVVAALRQQFPDIHPDIMKGIIQRTSIDIESSGWSYDIGYGVINAYNALKLLQKKL